MARNQRPFGWEMDIQPPPSGMPPPPNRFASLPYDGNGPQSYKLNNQPTWLPPRPNPLSTTKIKRRVRTSFFSSFFVMHVYLEIPSIEIYQSPLVFCCCFFFSFQVASRVDSIWFT